MTVKLGNATVDQMAKALKKAVRKSHDALKVLAEIKPGVFNKNGNLSSKRIAAEILADNRDCFTRGGKLNDIGKMRLAEDGLKLNQSVKKAFKKVVDEFQSSEKVKESVQKAIQSAKDIISKKALAQKLGDTFQSVGKKL